MKKILYIEASPRKDRSHSINVTKKYIEKFNKDNEYEVKKIDLWNYDLPEFDGDMLNAGQQNVKLIAERVPSELPWGELGVDIVVESTGIFRQREQLEQHF